jgi:hypothetical protein
LLAYRASPNQAVGKRHVVLDFVPVRLVKIERRQQLKNDRNSSLPSETIAGLPILQTGVFKWPRSALSPPGHDGPQSAVGDAADPTGGDIEVGSACRVVADC